MFELAIALKYLLPRRRQLSVSIIALLSILVIALVVWLLVVFLSVTRGMEQRWMKTLVALNAPIRLTPTEEYYNSYYYQVDQYSLAAGYGSRTVGEKLAALDADPYDAVVDPELPMGFPSPDRDPEGTLLDPVRGAFGAVEKLEGFSGVAAREFEVAMANLRLRLLHYVHQDPFSEPTYEQSFSSQASYLGTFDGETASLMETLLPPTAADITHQLDLLSLSGDNVREEMPTRDRYLRADERTERLNAYLGHVTIAQLKSREGGWIWPEDTSVIVPDTVVMEARLDEASLETATEADELLFEVSFEMEGVTYQGTVPYKGLAVAGAEIRSEFTKPPSHPPSWAYRVEQRGILPSDPGVGQGIALAKAFQEQGARLGDRGYLSFYAGGPSGLQEQRLPVFVAAFYDPGLLPTGSRYVLVNPDVARTVRASVNQIEEGKGNGINVWIDDLSRVDEAKAQILNQLDRAGLAPYWRVETFKEFEFAKPLVQQFDSDRNLLTVIAIIVIAVACSNIVSMLIVLVNDKRKEIGILRSMGAKARSVALIFATSGLVMGVSGSLLGIGAALLTLANLDRVVALLSALQGHEAFQASFYGSSLPSEIDPSVLLFTIGATALVSLVAGLVPAIKAARVKPALILRSEG